MNTATLKGNWNITKGKLKQKYAQLTDDDLVFVEGQEDELLGRIQKRTGRSHDEISTFLSDECDCDLGLHEAHSAPVKLDRAARSRLVDFEINSD